MKQILTSIVLILSLASCKKEVNNNIAIDEEISRLTPDATSQKLVGTEKVKLLKARTVAAYYASSYIREKAFYVEVDSMPFSKSVIVHHKMSDGSWRNFPLKKITSTNTKSEIWGWELNYGAGTLNAATYATVGFSDEFVLKYSVNGQVYWDNNNGKNYSISNPLVTDGMFMQDGLNISADTYHTNFTAATTNGILRVFADVRNISYAKEVTLVYTTNNWQTVSYSNLNYANTYGFGGSNYSLNPSSKNFEKWSVMVTLPSAATAVTYAIRYRVNGLEYWDNNYGKNYIKIRL